MINTTAKAKNVPYPEDSIVEVNDKKGTSSTKFLDTSKLLDNS